jgi:hypothetical protein
MSNAFPLFNTVEHKMNLERIFFYEDRFKRDKKFSIEGYLAFMALCQRCGLYFNQVKNDKEMLCLYHPGVIVQSLFFYDKHSPRENNPE